MNQTCDPIVDDIALTLSIASTLHVKSLSQTRLAARASGAKPVVDKQRELVKTLQTVEGDANFMWDVKAEARNLRRNLVFFSNIT